jgi:hypothetical protein
MKILFFIILSAVAYRGLSQENVNRNIHTTNTVEVNYWQKKMDQLKEQYYWRFTVGDKIFNSPSSLESFVKMKTRLLLKPDQADILRIGKFSALKVSPVIRRFQFMEWALPMMFIL